MHPAPALLAACLLLAASLQPAALAFEEDDKQAILALIARMEAAWNRGDFRGYMEGFANPDVVFVSRGRFQEDWQGTLDHYIRDYGASEATRGTLRFSDIRIEMLAPDAAQLVSRYRLDRALNPQDGINTRLMRKRDGRWVIALNHVSAREIPCTCGAENASAHVLHGLDRVQHGVIMECSIASDAHNNEWDGARCRERE